ncbi:unnamed protein product [Ectocarpus sp. CCAP 1310/34]|nr:unnamed protein product [Ectocarpus sp. CCAP 1310/34]
MGPLPSFWLGKIPRQLGDVRRLEKLELVGNNLDGPIPTEVVNLRYFDKFNTGVLDAESSRLPTGTVMLQVFFGYLDLVSDLYTAVSYYESGDSFWFTLVLAFALGPGIIASVFFLTPTIVRVRVPWVRRVLVATQLSLLVEAWRNVAKRRFTPILEVVRLIEALFESVPQLLLQLYAALLLWSSPERNVLRLGSVCISAGSLAYNATDLFSAKRLERCSDPLEGGICPCCSWLTGLPFSRVPEKGSSRLNGWGDVHPRTHVWLCLLYHILEIVSRFVPLAMLALVMRKWFFLVLPYLWWSRYAVRKKAAAWTRKSTRETDKARPRKSVTERVRVKLVAMPFLDSVMDGSAAFGLGLVVTLVEFIVCVVIYHLYNHDDLPTNLRLGLYVVASSCMVGKLLLAALAIFPLRADEDGPGIFGSAVASSSGSALGGPSETVGDVDEGVVALANVMEIDEGKVDELERPSGTPLAGASAAAVSEAVEGGLDGDVENALISERAPSEGMRLPPTTHALSTPSPNGLAVATNAATGDAQGDNGEVGGNGDQLS